MHLEPEIQSLFNLFSQASEASQFALENKDRHPYCLLGVVTNNKDPEKKRRIKCSIASVPSLETYWIQRLTPYPDLDAPLPVPGETVMLIPQMGDQTKLFYTSIHNNTNPPFKKEDEINDWWLEVPGTQQTKVVKDQNNFVEGNQTETIGKDQDLTVEKDQTVEIKGSQDVTVTLSATHNALVNNTLSAGAVCTVSNDAGASIVLYAGGAVAITSGSGQSLILGGASGGLGIQSDFVFTLAGTNAIWNLAGESLSIINAENVTINGKSIATIGALDDDGDILISKGY